MEAGQGIVSGSESHDLAAVVDPERSSGERTPRHIDGVEPAARIYEAMKRAGARVDEASHNLATVVDRVGFDLIPAGDIDGGETATCIHEPMFSSVVAEESNGTSRT